MAPYKLEDNIREKLEARELKPSANAWEKLESKLDAEQHKKKPVFWYYAAASIVGFLILASIFFGTNNFETQQQIVDADPEEMRGETNIIPNNSKIKKIASEEPNSEKTDNGASKKEANKVQRENSNSIKPIPNKKSAIDKRIEKNEAVAQTSNNEFQKSVIKEKTIISEDEKVFNLKVEEVVASVKQLQTEKTEVTAAEVEKLLNRARREIQTQRILNSTKVDATALLQDVEWEVEKSFRDKVFDALGEGFQKVRTAVSERND